MPSSGSPWLVEPTIFVKTTFDYLVVGGGTAGLTLASRLAEDTRYKIGVIEAGPYLPEDPRINTPANWLSILRDTSSDYAWNLATTPQKHAHDRTINLPRGKILGGSSAVNLMAYTRANKSDYDNWEKLGNKGWGWEGLLPYFKKAETYVPKTPDVVFPSIDSADKGKAEKYLREFHGTEGPLKITHNETYDSTIHPAVKTLNALGIPINMDPDSGNVNGVLNIPSSVDRTNGMRSYSANTYLASVLGQGNIFVVTNAHASKIVFSSNDHHSGKGLCATGVEFVSGGESFTAQAAREVILSAGTYQTPQLLELSGIGDAKRLSAIGIPCVIDLPEVGENYQDHLSVSVLSNPKYGSPDSGQGQDNVTAKDPTRTIPVCSFSPLKDFIPKADLEDMIRNLDKDFRSIPSTPLREAQFTLQRSAIDANISTAEILLVGEIELPGDPSGRSYLLTAPICQHPFSRGHVHIHSKDPLANPIIEGNFLESTFDLEVLNKASQLCSKLVATEPLKSHLLGRILPDDTTQTDDQYRNFVRQGVQTAHHPVGTAAMAPRELGGVVDTSLRVYHTHNVRVVDASIIPLHFTGHPQATVYAIAEKAADIIKGGL